MYSRESTEPQFTSPVRQLYLHQVAEMKTTIKVYMSADMLGIESLKLVTIRKIIDMIANKTNNRFLEIVLETLFSTVPNGSLLRDAIVDACAHNYNKVRSLPTTVALLEEHETRIWRLARQNYITQVGKIEHFVRETIASTCKERRCQGVHPGGAQCNLYSISSTAVGGADILWAKVQEDGMLSATARCYECNASFSFDVQP